MVKEFVYLPTGRGVVRLRWVGGWTQSLFQEIARALR